VAREARPTTAFIAVYTSKGTRGKLFLSKLQILILGRPSQLKGRSPIKSWRRKASNPLTLVHSVVKGLRIQFLRSGTGAFNRAKDEVDWDLVAPLEPDVLVSFEGPLARLENVVGMMTRHAEDLGVGGLVILFPSK
jgi:hypothetical protein